jgi:hypothetical protein
MLSRLTVLVRKSRVISPARALKPLSTIIDHAPPDAVHDKGLPWEL